MGDLIPFPRQAEPVGMSPTVLLQACQTLATTLSSTHAAVVLYNEATGPTVIWSSTADPLATLEMSRAARDAATAIAAGDDPGEVCRDQWARRQATRAAATE